MSIRLDIAIPYCLGVQFLFRILHQNGPNLVDDSGRASEPFSSRLVRQTRRLFGICSSRHPSFHPCSWTGPLIAWWTYLRDTTCPTNSQPKPYSYCSTLSTTAAASRQKIPITKSREDEKEYWSKYYDIASAHYQVQCQGDSRFWN